MTLVLNNLEGGTNTTAITAANSGGTSGTAFTAVGGTGCTFSTTANQQGSLGMLCTSAASVSNYVEWQGITGGTTACAVRFYFRMTALPVTNDQSLTYMRSSGGGTGLSTLQLETGTGKLYLNSDAAGILATTKTTGGLAINTWYRIEYGMTDPSTTTGTFSLRVYLGDSTTAISNMSVDATALNIGSASVLGTVRFGRPTPLAEAFTCQYDQMAFQTGSATLIGPPASNVAPTANAGSDKTATVSTNLVITGSDSDTDGTIASRAWTVVSSVNGAAPTLTNANTAAVTFNSAAGGSVHTLRYTVTDNNGATGSDDVIVYVPSSVVKPIADTSNPGSWTNVGGAGSGNAALADALDSTYIQSPAIASGAAFRTRLAPLITPSTFSLTVRHALSSAGANTALVRLYEGATLRKEWTVVPTTTMSDTVVSLTSGEIATVTSWNALDVEFNWTAS